MYNPIFFIQANVDRFPQLESVLESLPRDAKNKQLQVE